MARVSKVNLRNIMKIAKKLERGGWLTKGFVGGSSYWIERAAMDVDEWIEDFNMASESKPPRDGWLTK